MGNTKSPLAVVTGAYSGIGFHLALPCATAGRDLVQATDAVVETVNAACKRGGVTVQILQTRWTR